MAIAGVQSSRLAVFPGHSDISGRMAYGRSAVPPKRDVGRYEFNAAGLASGLHADDASHTMLVGHPIKDNTHLYQGNAHASQCLSLAVFSAASCTLLCAMKLLSQKA